MFSGIVAAIGCIEHISQSDTTHDRAVRIRVENGEFLLHTTAGGSISCSGVCLTVVEKGDSFFVVNVSKATLYATNLINWAIGTKVNLESSLKMGDPMDGHMVQGHVDCVGTICSLESVEGSHTMEVSCNTAISKYMVYKGSITVDGVSLTINAASPGRFKVNLIPYTWNNTTFQYNKVGDPVNIETDLIARHLEALVAAYVPQTSLENTG